MRYWSFRKSSGKKFFDDDNMEVGDVDLVTIIVYSFLFLERFSVNQKVDWYLDEFVSEMEQLTGKVASIPTLWRSLKHLGKRFGYLELLIRDWILPLTFDQLQNEMNGYEVSS